MKAGKKIDNSCLSVDNAEDRGFIHRDYIAHALRWSHVTKYLTLGDKHLEADVLDIGCGVELPLARMMYSSRMSHDTGSYTGIDINKLRRPESIPPLGRFNLNLLGETNFVEAKLPFATFDCIVCFEMLEHVEPEMSFATLARIHSVLKDGGVAFISTPCYDPKMGAAVNHINEMSYAAMKALILAIGFEIEAVYGTFASQRDYIKLLTKAQREIWDKLIAYYDANLVSCIFAPLFPEQSRNCIWRLKRGKVSNTEPLRDVIDQRHSSSTLWPAFINKLLAE